MKEESNSATESFDKLQEQYTELLQFALDGLAAGLSQDQRNQVADVIKQFLSK